MDISAKHEKLLQNGTALVVGVASWAKASTRKYGAYAPTVVGAENAILDAIGNTFGAPVESALINASGNPAQFTQKGHFQTNWLGWLNKYTLGGAALMVADGLAEEYLASEYRKIDFIKPFVKGGAVGAIGGGIICGVFDAIPATPTRSTATNYTTLSYTNAGQNLTQIAAQMNARQGV